ncbi:hypothetical protein OIU77_017266 [Salix suchowensis]|uniref:Core-2/I-branching beta-1,6-N-acetylglucosaminyltransferase family protein n=1 Tax=Salix suchowensis TaxID=1278906 RepID=A0ABQ8ZNR9_9ROSI|nr:hypothetical protein OIU77_017266 [Salix suchowensis]
MNGRTLFFFAKPSSASASASASATHYPSAHSHLTSKSKKLKIAFLFLTNTDLFFAPLWEQFFKSADKNLFNIYVHADPHSNVTKPSGIFFSHFIPDAKRTYRASPTLISATRRLLANAILDDPNQYLLRRPLPVLHPSPFFQIRLQFANQF